MSDFSVSFLLPTARDRFRDVMRTWDCDNAELLVSYEVSNPGLQRLTDEEKQSFKAEIREFEHNGSENGIVAAWNFLATQSTKDAIMILADDIWNVTPNWREIVINHLPKFIEQAWAVAGNDKQNAFQNKLAGHPLVSRKYYDLFGYIWYPEYKSYGCDNEFYEVGMELGRLIYIDDFIFENRHAGCWEGETADKWSASISSTGASALSILNQKDRIQNLINEKMAKCKHMNI